MLCVDISWLGLSGCKPCFRSALTQVSADSVSLASAVPSMGFCVVLGSGRNRHFSALHAKCKCFCLQELMSPDLKGAGSICLQAGLSQCCFEFLLVSWEIGADTTAGVLKFSAQKYFSVLVGVPEFYTSNGYFLLTVFFFLPPFSLFLPNTLSLGG